MSTANALFIPVLTVMVDYGDAYRVVYDKPCEDPNHHIDERTEILADGTLSLLATDGIVSTLKRGSTTKEDHRAVLDWVRQRPEVAEVEVGDFVDGWHDWDDAP